MGRPLSRGTQVLLDPNLGRRGQRAAAGQELGAGEEVLLGRRRVGVVRRLEPDGDGVGWVASLPGTP